MTISAADRYPSIRELMQDLYPKEEEACAAEGKIMPRLEAKQRTGVKSEPEPELELEPEAEPEPEPKLEPAPQPDPEKSRSRLPGWLPPKRLLPEGLPPEKGIFHLSLSLRAQPCSFSWRWPSGLTGSAFGRRTALWKQRRHRQKLPILFPNSRRRQAQRRRRDAQAGENAQDAQAPGTAEEPPAAGQNSDETEETGQQEPLPLIYGSVQEDGTTWINTAVQTYQSTPDASGSLDWAAEAEVSSEYTFSAEEITVFTTYEGTDGPSPVSGSMTQKGARS